MKKRNKETRWGRTIGWWGASLIIVIVLVGYPTDFRYSRWVYGLIWGCLTTVVIYLFRSFFESDADEEWVMPNQGRKKDDRT